jgi:hypothetical protein
MPRGPPFPIWTRIAGSFMEKRVFFGSLMKQGVLSAKNFSKAGLDFFGNPPIAS